MTRNNPIVLADFTVTLSLFILWGVTWFAYPLRQYDLMVGRYRCIEYACQKAVLNCSIATSLLLQIQSLKETYKPFCIRERVKYCQYYFSNTKSGRPSSQPHQAGTSCDRETCTSFSLALQSRLKVVGIFPLISVVNLRAANGRRLPTEKGAI